MDYPLSCVLPAICELLASGESCSCPLLASFPLLARACVVRCWRTSRYWRELWLPAIGWRPAIGGILCCSLLARVPQLAGSCLVFPQLARARCVPLLAGSCLLGYVRATTCGDAMLFLVGHASVSSVGLLDQSCVGTIAQSGVRFITQLMSRIDAIVPRESSREIASSQFRLVLIPTT
jgi:hypothetical protein